MCTEPSLLCGLQFLHEVKPEIKEKLQRLRRIGKQSLADDIIELFPGCIKVQIESRQTIGKVFLHLELGSQLLLDFGKIKLILVAHCFAHSLVITHPVGEKFEGAAFLEL